jgi:hypothetical protein
MRENIAKYKPILTAETSNCIKWAKNRRENIEKKAILTADQVG